LKQSLAQSVRLEALANNAAVQGGNDLNWAALANVTTTLRLGLFHLAIKSAPGLPSHGCHARHVSAIFALASHVPEAALAGVAKRQR
jgi:hypothetical protein